MKPLDPYLYILMRTDLDSLNPGKAIAQGSHAATMFSGEIHDRFAESTEVGDAWMQMYQQWQTDPATDRRLGFGVKICLAVNSEVQLRQKVTVARHLPMTLAGIVTDPSYPLRDGRVMHLLPLVTCGYIFGDKELLTGFLGDLELHP